MFRKLILRNGAKERDYLAEMLHVWRHLWTRNLQQYRKPGGHAVAILLCRRVLFDQMLWHTNTIL
jgi:hypothetical protein